MTKGPEGIGTERGLLSGRSLGFGLLLAGVAAVSLIIYAGVLNTNFFERTTPLRRLSDHVRHQITLAHLWLEERFAEDRTIDVDQDVLARFDGAREVIAAALGGGQSAIGSFRAVASPDLRRELWDLSRMIADLRTDAARRWGDRGEGGTGSRLDQAFDSKFSDVIARCDAISSDVEAVLASDRRGLTFVNYGLLGLIAALFGVVAYLATRSRRAVERRAKDLEVLVRARTAELETKEARIRKILDQAGEGMITFTSAGRIESMNAAASAMFGIDGRTPVEVMALLDGDAAGQERALSEIRAMKSTSIEVLGRAVDGRTFPMEVSPSAVELANRIVHTWIVRDVTVRRQVEEERRLAQASLQEMNDKLEVACDAAEAANRAKSAFLANMSHEIRTPLNAVIGFNELLRETPLDERQHDLVEKAERSGRTLLSLLNSVLDFSKIEAGKMEVEKTTFDLRSVIDDVSAVLSEEAVKKGLRFSCDCSADLPAEVVGDPQRIRQILLNLSGNAVKFTEAGSVSIRAEPDAVAPFVRFSVVDTGCGLSDEVRAALFEPFSQGDVSTTRRYGGTGLGLAISKELTTLMGGELTVRASGPRGTAFALRLPLAPADAAPCAAPSFADVPSTVRGGGRRVLVAEDHPLNREVVAKMLDGIGFVVDVAEDGRRAVERFDGARHCLVLMDSQMPEMDGCTAARLIRAREAGASRVPIVALTANATAEERARTRAAGMDDFLTKPIRLERLTAVLAQWLEPDGADDSAADHEPAMAVEAGEAVNGGAAVDAEAIERLRRLGGVDDGFAVRMTRLFVRDGDELVRDLKRAIDIADRDEAALIAHRLKGAASQVGASRVSGVCHDIEAALVGGADASALGLRLVDEFDAARRAFESLNGNGA